MRTPKSETRTFLEVYKGYVLSTLPYWMEDDDNCYHFSGHLLHVKHFIVWFNFYEKPIKLGIIEKITEHSAWTGWFESDYLYDPGQVTKSLRVSALSYIKWV